MSTDACSAIGAIGDLSETVVDVAVFGSGAAGLAAAVTAAEAGCTVVLFEKAGAVGGTTAKSGGVYWIPNNHLMREHGVEDPREGAVGYMARVSAPDRYSAEDALLGLTAWEHDHIVAYYDLAAEAVEFLDTTGALRSTIETALRFPDYHMNLPEQGGVYGRALCPADEQNRPASGGDLIAQLAAAARRLGVQIVTGHAFTDLILEDGQVVGAVVRDLDSARDVRARARLGVVLAVGGFTHDAERRSRHLPARVWGGCAAGENTGDALPALEALDIPLHNMDCAWWDEVAIEQTLGGTTETRAGMWVAPGDSSLIVDLAGRRVVNEKLFYSDRAKIHIGPGAPDLLVLLFDERTQQLFSMEQFAYPLVLPGESATHLVSGDSWEGLSANLVDRLLSLQPATGGARLSRDFTANLAVTIDRFNDLAAMGIDTDHGRGAEPIEVFFTGQPRAGGGPNPVMAPLSAEGPFFAVLIGLGTLDTKGGPRTTSAGQVLGLDGVPVDGLYAVGNCAASPSNDGYWAAGATIGPALAFGYGAGRHLAARLATGANSQGQGVTQ
ncbi:FAD-dependent oxidoreductase [Rhodococcus sp. OK302]|uniref:FAD-dependent oxidoreductase n=1 Tax=Rhodococcus sp. OK302 TaxID=1882769 RepID=UPI000B93EF69|nr:FAD-dependent oxidoreductase [Rhodococcus sp. OK302]OYD61434.1 FAD binding domain-containing protein [Rhodococcus sp. OK302]